MSECGHVMGVITAHNSVQDTIELLQARVSALDAATLDQVEARLQVHMTTLGETARFISVTWCSRLVHTETDGISSQKCIYEFQHLNK